MNINEPLKETLYAGFWRRALAILLDVLMLQVVVVIVSFPIGLAIGYYLTGHVAPSDLEALYTVVSVGLALTLQWLYFALMESSALQATLGKMALGIRVTTLDGSRMSLGRASGRYISKYLSILSIIGFYLAGWTKRKQALHDFIVGTVVVRKVTA
ncbi:RDD family protein [Polycyclovorans algicola]|uniref:RDD family protein n=1 Tax=Polycyclovorans algicola TaxID=616992 RepID=UPI0004A74579|nr:RDD family protein [Polycyclovorans algicola]